MTFAESVKSNLGRKYFFVMRGRASRSEFWWFMLFIGLVNLVAGLIVAVLPVEAGSIFSLIISLLLLPPNLSVTVRRFHDRNLRGWWILVPMAPLFFWILSGGFSAAPNMLFSLLSLILCLAYLLILCLPGTPGSNRFGDVPA